MDRICFLFYSTAVCNLLTFCLLLRTRRKKRKETKEIVNNFFQPKAPVLCTSFHPNIFFISVGLDGLSNKKVSFPEEIEQNKQNEQINKTNKQTNERTHKTNKQNKQTKIKQTKRTEEPKL